MSEFGVSLQKLRDGKLVDFLCRDDFSAWVDLVALPQIQLLARAIRGRNEDHFLGYSRQQVQTLARRVLLSRRLELLESMRPLWIAFRSSQENCGLAESALHSAAGWSGEILAYGQGAAEKAFSVSHAEFVETLGKLADRDQDGPLGAAVRSTRLFDEARHVGFPVVFFKNGDSSLQPGVWIEPTLMPKGVTDDLGREWERLLTTLRSRISTHRHYALPSWLHGLAACDVNIETLESAGLSLVMHGLAEQQKLPLPFGVGFTGRWENDRLRGVRELGVKALAAREAGVFLLFACPDPNEPTPTATDGIKVVLLPEHLSLDDVIRFVNRILPGRVRGPRSRAKPPKSVEATNGQDARAEDSRRHRTTACRKNDATQSLGMGARPQGLDV
ncbi:MAG TPA: hypothetical protein VND64_31810 [Pirellulales bacterium]|nr:hypothetical protein [Pirellulales bacterium]